jgi:hypothetical protein
VPKWEEDRELAPDLAVAESFLTEDIEPHIGDLQ